jgi:hypothetical protein
MKSPVIRLATTLLSTAPAVIGVVGFSTSAAIKTRLSVFQTHLEEANRKTSEITASRNDSSSAREGTRKASRSSGSRSRASSSI